MRNLKFANQPPKNVEPVILDYQWVLQQEAVQKDFIEYIKQNEAINNE